MNRINIFRYIAYFSDSFYILEIMAILGIVLLTYSSVSAFYSGTGFLYPPFYILQSFFMVYSAFTAFSFANKIERGVIGHVFSMPINRLIFLRSCEFFEVVMLPAMIIIPSFMITELSEFSLRMDFLSFVFLFSVAIISFMVSLGRILAVIVRNGIIAFLLTFGFFEALSLMSNYFASGSFFWFISNGMNSLATIGASSISTEVSIALLFVAILFFEFSNRLLLRLNLKNGR